MSLVVGSVVPVRAKVVPLKDKLVLRAEGCFFVMLQLSKGQVPSRNASIARVVYAIPLPSRGVAACLGMDNGGVSVEHLLHDVGG